MAWLQNSGFFLLGIVAGAFGVGYLCCKPTQKALDKSLKGWRHTLDMNKALKEEIMPSVRIKHASERRKRGL